VLNIGTMYVHMTSSICTKFQKGHVCKNMKNENFGLSPRANHERFPWLGSIDMTDTLSISSLGPHAT